MPQKKPIKPKHSTTTETVTSYKYSSKRKNIPPAGLEAHGLIREVPRIRYEYNPHLPPILRSSPDAGKADHLLSLLRNALLRTLGQPAERKLLEEATKRTLTRDEAIQIQTIFERAITPNAAQYLADVIRRSEPWLEWSGKREKPWFQVQPVALHLHERISTQAILRVLAREDVRRPQDQVEIDQDDLMVGPLGERGAEVHRESGRADPAARREHGDNLTLRRAPRVASWLGVC